MPVSVATHAACGTCRGTGARPGTAPSVCPVCQGIALLRSVRPETVDRLADLAGALAATLRDIAAQGRETGPGSADSDAGPRPKRSRSRVEDIEVSEESGQ